MAVSKVEIERRVRRFTETCRTHSVKLTHQRMEVFRQLAGAEAPPDAETIYQNVSRGVLSISRDTVYRTLSTLEEHGLMRKAEILSDKARYDAIDKGDYPSWKVCMQIMPPERAKTYRWNIFDITKVWPPRPKK